MTTGDFPKSQKALSILVVVEWVLGVLLAVRILISGNSDWNVLAFMLLFIIVHVPILLFAAWALVFRPPLRRKAALVFSLPFAFFFIPAIARETMTDPIPLSWFGGLLVAGVVAAGLIAAVRPKHAAARLPNWFFENPAINGLVLLMPVVGWLLPGIATWFIATADKPGGSSGTSPGMGIAYLFMLLATYFAALGVLSAFAALWGWLGLRSRLDGACRKLHIGQLVASAPGIIVGVVLLAFALGNSPG